MYIFLKFLLNQLFQFDSVRFQTKILKYTPIVIRPNQKSNRIILEANRIANSCLVWLSF